MPFEVGDRQRIEPGVAVGAAQRVDLAFGRRGQDRRVASVAGAAGALDDRVDPVLVAHGVVVALEHDRPGPFAEHDSVGPLVVGPHVAARGDRLEVREHVPEGRDLAEVQPGRHGQVAASDPQPIDGLLDRDQRAGAGGVDHVGAAPQVQPVRDPAGHEVRNAGGDALGVAPRQGAVPAGFELAKAVGAKAGEFGGEEREQPADRVHPQERLGHLAADVPAAADDHVGRVPQGAVGGDAGVGERRVDDLEGHELVGVAGLKHVRHDAEAMGVEGEARGEEPAPRTADAGRVVLGQVVEGGTRPPLGRDVGHGIHAVDVVSPELIDRSRPGEHAGQAHHGHIPVHAEPPPVNSFMR